MSRRMLAMWGTVLALLLILIVAASSLAADGRTAGLLAAVAILGVSVVLGWPRPLQEDAESVQVRQALTSQQEALDQHRAEFEQARVALLSDISMRTERLDQRERDLIARFARFREFLEYPVEDVHADASTAELQQLGEKDRQVHQLLEAEAERVYEKIRKNGYSSNGQVDTTAIREEALLLMRQVALIYKPDCRHPLLETSFEQLARAASRICLHVLVLLERLPVSVQHYNISTLYGYLQKAVAGYGMYQKASPWLTYLSRGLYAGRMASATNPATLGAWWLATELGKRGAQKVIENVVDRQAVAVLHEVVAVIGVEAAGIYGTGFRQRDPAWILGTELVELIQAFPVSGESLNHGLRRITALPLRSEYDRIYLYRCLAEHRSAGLQLADPAMLSREDRERIARELEEFYSKYIHGRTSSAVATWRLKAETRLDLKLHLEERQTVSASSVLDEYRSAAQSLAAFLFHVLTLEQHQAEAIFRSLVVSARLSDTDRAELLRRAEIHPNQLQFEPPELDPTSDATKVFLSDLASCCTANGYPDHHVEQLVIETWQYFRRQNSEANAALDAAWKTCVQRQDSQVPASDLPFGLARTFLIVRQESERLSFWFGDLSSRVGESLTSLPDVWLLGLNSGGTSEGRLIVVTNAGVPAIIWQAPPKCRIQRRSGILVDDAVLADGEWMGHIPETGGMAAVLPPAGADLVISGNLRGGRFKTYFRKLLEFTQSEIV